MEEGSTSTVIVKKVRRREPDTVAGPCLAALVLLLLLLTLLLPSDGADRLPDDAVASNPYWRPDEITAQAQLPPAEDFSSRGLVLNEEEQLVLHFERSLTIDKPVALTAAAMPAIDLRYYGRPYPVPVYIYLPMWHHGHHWSYYRLAQSSADGESDAKDPTKLPEGSVVIPEPSAPLLLLLSILPPALRRRRKATVR